MFPRAIQIACVLVVLGSGAGSGSMMRVARANDDAVEPYLSQARSKMAALKYHDAQPLLEKALAQGNNGPAQLAEIYRMAAEVAAGLGQEETARAEFERLLAIRPDTTLPEGTSPKIARPFAAARAAQETREPLRVRYQVVDRPKPKIVLVVVSDPLGMVAGARARFRLGKGSESSVSAKGFGRLELSLPADKSLDVIVSATDVHGNELIVHGSWAVPIRVPSPSAGGRRDRTPRAAPPLYARWYLWGGVGVAFAAAGTYFGSRMLAAEDDLAKLNDDSRNIDTPFEDAEAIVKRGRRNAILANVGFVTAGVAGVVSAILLVRALRRPRETYERTAVAPYVGDGVGVTVWLRF